MRKEGHLQYPQVLYKIFIVSIQLSWDNFFGQRHLYKLLTLD